MIIRNIQVYGYTDDNSQLQDIHINSQGQLSLTGTKSLPAFSTTTMIDAKGEYSLLPGWLDVHVHGFGGYDFADANDESLAKITKALGQTGLSYCLATIVSLAIPQLKTTLAAIDRYVLAEQASPTPGRSTIVGVHLEGPFIAKNCNGAHDAAILQDSIDCQQFLTIIAAAPHIHYWKITLAPELPGAIDFIRDIHQHCAALPGLYVSIFIGHSNADEKLVAQAMDAGAIGFTHLGNANREQVHREQYTLCHHHLKSNVVRWVMAPDNKKTFYCELITDGQHLSDPFIQFVHSRHGQHIIPITDALGPSGLADGDYQLGQVAILKQGEKFVLKQHPEKLAGSTVIAHYAALLTEPEKIPAIYQATVLNPRRSCLLKNLSLTDQRNFVIINQQAQLILSSCNGQIQLHRMDANWYPLLAAKQIAVRCCFDKALTNGGD
jgi:N-acetylglucosamine-6-phosphate deacetylase